MWAPLDLLVQARGEIGRLQVSIGARWRVWPRPGMIGTLVGLVQMLGNMEDPQTIGPAMAIALLTTLYGALISNLIALPIADKLASKAQLEYVIRTPGDRGHPAHPRQDQSRRDGRVLSAYLLENQRQPVAA